VSQPTLTERLGIVGTGAVARGLARVAAPRGEVVVWARTEQSAEQARAAIGDGVSVVTDLEQLGDRTYVIESVVERLPVKRELLERIGAVAGEDAVVASTTSSLSIQELARASGRPSQFAGIHLFNPVEKMELVEVAFPRAASADTRRRSHDLCGELGKTAVEVPDTPGFVVNRLLFPYLFNAVKLLEEHDLDPDTVDSCMQLGAGHPMGPLRLLDLVGLDVSASIAESIGVDVPRKVRMLIEEGRLGRKTGGGFYDYDK
jgi:3-hydroxybutyryl-CoA dehydrogenase